MNFTDVIQSLNDSAIGTMVRESGTLFPWLESIHVLMVAIVVGTIAIVDLRLMGYASHRRGARQLIIDTLPFTWMAFVGAVLTGLGLFLSNAVGYVDSKPFIIKMVVLALAGVNMAVFHLTAYRRIGDWDETMPTPTAAKVSGALSLTFWIVVIFLGRWIGFSAPFM